MSLLDRLRGREDALTRDRQNAAAEIERLTADLAKVRAIVDCCADECEPDDSLEVNERVAVLRVERDELKEIVDKLPVTADGVTVLPGAIVWGLDLSERNVQWRADCGYLAWWSINGPPIEVSDCYSTREAARDAKEKKP